MKAIIINDNDCKDLVRRLKLESMQEDRHFQGFSGDDPVSIRTVHRSFHYVVVGWLQDQGADLS